MLRESKLVRYPFGNYWWQEVNPHEYQIRRADPSQTLVGRLVEVPAHGRDKGKWLLPDADQEYPASETAVMGLELWHKLDAATAPVNGNGHLAPAEPPAAMEEPSAPPPRADLAPPDCDTTGYLGTTEAAAAYGMSRPLFLERLKADLIPGAVKVRFGNKAGFRYLVPPPTPVETPTPEPAPPAPIASEPPHSHDELYREVGCLNGRIDALQHSVTALTALVTKPRPTPPSFWQRLTGTSPSGTPEGGPEA